MAQQPQQAQHPVCLPIEKDPDISSAVLKFLEVTKHMPPLEKLGPEGSRIFVFGAQMMPVDVSGVKVDEPRTIEQDGVKVKIHVVRPEGVKDPLLPAFMFFHGGGFLCEDYFTHRRLVRDLVVNSGAIAVVPDYSLSPENKYPVAVNECYAATKWVAIHGKEIGIDGSRLAVAGNSAGGNLAAVIPIIAKEKKFPPLKLQILMWPWVDMVNYEYDTCYKYQKDRYFTPTTIKWMTDLYTNSVEERKDIHLSPIFATKQQLHGLPPALLQIAQSDILRDGGQAYGRLLDSAGVPTTTVVYDGVIHDWGVLNILSAIPQTNALVVQAGAELKKYLFK